ncbi:MAG: BamA/TamA family outer membrane protein [Elusimicrobia bacterium]|nr:BamA/TamA family outer membrane protein [Elusimicrobiota bacterium]
MRAQALLKKRVLLRALFFVLPIFSLANEGNRSAKTTLTHIHVSGHQSLSTPDVQNALGLKIGKRYRIEKVHDAFERLRPVLVDKGFLDIRISTAVLISPADFSISITVEEGPLFRLGVLTVEGNQDVNHRHIFREMEMSPGEPFSPSRLKEGNKRLYATGCFDVVNLTLSTAPHATVNVKTVVRERRNQFIKGGAGYGTETKERLTLGYEDQSFFGGARRLDIQFTYSGFITQPEKFETQTLESTLIQPFLLGTRMEGRFTLERSRKYREAYDSIESEMRSSLERRYKSNLSLRLTHRLQGTTLTRVSPEAQTPSETSINALGASLRFDDTDDPFLPFDGWRTMGALEEGLTLFKTDVGFHKFETRVGRFGTGESGWTFFGGGQFGVMFPASGEVNDSIPINERFFLGGGNTVRGYSERSLGPKDDQGNPLGGTLYLVGNFELRHRIHKKLFGVAFVDIGNLYGSNPGDTSPQVDLNDLDNLKKTGGIGFRLHSPVGAIRLEGGYQFNPDGSTHFKDRTAIHFSIGEVF